MKTELIERYFDAWNKHDSEAIVNCFAEEGIYFTPSTNKELSRNEIKQYAEDLISAFPDLSFELKSFVTHDNLFVGVEWLLQGTNTKPLLENLPPTTNSLSLPGADFIKIEDNYIRSVKRYFDQKSMFEQLGLDNIVQPQQVGNMTFGYSLRTGSSNKKRPNAMALTWIIGDSKEELERITGHATRINQEWTKAPGFIGMIVGMNQNRGFTISAWEELDNVTKATRDCAHASAMKEFRQIGGLSSGVFTSVWVPHKLNALWTRCKNCGTPNDGTAEVCVKCGVPLPEQPPFW